jgi:hypothetical protein
MTKKIIESDVRFFLLFFIVRWLHARAHEFAFIARSPLNAAAIHVDRTRCPLICNRPVAERHDDGVSSPRLPLPSPMRAGLTLTALNGSATRATFAEEDDP